MAVESHTWEKQSTSLQNIPNIGFVSYKDKLLLHRTSLTETDLFQIDVTTGMYVWISNRSQFHASRSVFWVDGPLLWCLGHSIGKSELKIWRSVDGVTWEEMAEVQFPLDRLKEIPNRCVVHNGSIWVFFDGAIMKSVDKEYLSWTTVSEEFPWEKGYFSPWKTKEYLWSFGMSTRSVNMSIWYSEDGINWIRPSYLFTFPMLWGFSLESVSSGEFHVYGGKYLSPVEHRDFVYVKNPLSARPQWGEDQVPWTHLYGVRTFREGEVVVVGGGRHIHSGVENSKIWIQDVLGWKECFGGSPIDTRWIDIRWDVKRKQFWILALQKNDVVLYTHDGEKFRVVGNLQAGDFSNSRLTIVGDRIYIISPMEKTPSFRGNIFMQEALITNNDFSVKIDSKKVMLGTHVLQDLQWILHQGQDFFCSISFAKNLTLYMVTHSKEVVQVSSVPFVLRAGTQIASHVDHIWLYSDKVYKSIDGHVWEEVQTQGYQFIPDAKVFSYEDRLILYTLDKILVTKDGVVWEEISTESNKNDVSMGVCGMVGDDLLNFSLEDFSGERSWYRLKNFSDILHKKLEITK